MSFFKKNVAVALTVFAVLANAVLPGAAYAGTSRDSRTSGTKSGTVLNNVPNVLKGRLLEQTKALQKSGKTSKYAKAQIRWDDSSAKPSQIRGIDATASKNVANDVQAVFDELSPLYAQKNGAKKPKLETVEENVSAETGEKHVRIKQSYAGLEIVGGEIIGHVDENGKLYQIDGEYVNDVTVSTVPKISAEKALDAADAKYESKPKYDTTDPEIVILAEENGEKLAWQFEASFEDPSKGISRMAFEVDAETGKTIRSYETVKSTSPANLSGNLLSGEGGAGVTFSGTLYTGDNRYYMWDPFNRKHLVYNASTNSATYEDPNQYANRASNAWGMSDTVEASLAYNSQKTLDFFSAKGFTVSDIAFSNAGQTELPFFAHYGTGLANAFWNPGDGFYFGDGDGTSMAPLATLDVVAHEFGHAWTENTSALIYRDEAGALNESFSDIVGATVELKTQSSDKASYPNAAAGKGDWLIGEDILRVAGASSKSLRDMRNPANVATVGASRVQPTRYRGSNWYFGTSDNGGVHQNSGVQNFFYYLLAEGGKGTNDGLLYTVDGIGLDAAFDIAFETNENFLPSNADHAAARQAWIDAARSINPAYVSSVEAAWDAVGVYGETNYPAFVTNEESFEGSVSLPSGWTGGWTVTTSTGAVGSNSLVSPDISNSQSTSATLNATTDTGYVSFFARTSSELYFDKLELRIDGTKVDEWSGTGKWAPYAYPVNNGSHVFEWKYSKDSTQSAGLDEAGIDAVHMETLTGTVGVTSATNDGTYFSKNGFSATIAMGGSGTYVFQDPLGNLVRGSGSGTVSVSLPQTAEGSGSVSFQYRNERNYVSPIRTASFYVDATNPSSPTVNVPAISSTGAVQMSWSASSDTGSQLKSVPYAYEISSDSNFSSVSQSGTSAGLTANVTLADGRHYVRVRSYDKAGNASAWSANATVLVDTAAPASAISVSVNSGNIVGADEVSNVNFEANYGVGEAGGTATLEISTGTGLSIVKTPTVGSNGKASAQFDLQSFPDGILNYSAKLTDIAGNVSPESVGTVGKSALPSDGTISFASGSHVGQTATTIAVSASKAVNFELSGAGLASSVTGTVSTGGTVDVTVELSAGEGTKLVTATFTDGVGATSSASASVFLDLNPPSVSFDSHTEGQAVSGTGITLTGTVNDAGGLASFTVCGTAMPATNGAWSKSVSLSSGNSCTAVAVDKLGQTTTETRTWLRVPKTSNASASATTSSVTVSFDTDIASVGQVEYGTTPSLGNTVTESGTGTAHSITVSGLTEDTDYKFLVKASVGGTFGPSSAIFSVRTPKGIGSGEYGSDNTATGAAIFEEATSTGVSFGSSSGSVTVYSEDGQDSVTFELNGLEIETSGWDGNFSGPREATVAGSVNDSGYSQTGSTYAIGNDTARLGFTGGTATVRINLGAHLNGRTLRVYHSNDGVTYDRVGECQVSSAICEFAANHFSYYAFAVASDSTPDAFSFASVTEAATNAEVTSEAVTLTGFNAAATVSVVGGTYSVNNGSYVSTQGSVNPGDAVKIKLVSASAGSTDMTATITVGGVSGSFTVRTKASAVSGGGGGGGGGWSSVPVKSAPSQVVTGTGATNATKTAATKRKNVTAPKDPYAAVTEIAKSTEIAKLKKLATASNIPAGTKPKIDRLVTDRIIAELKLETKKTNESKALALEATAEKVSKIAKTKSSAGEKAVLGYVSASLKKKAEEIRKPVRKKNVVTKKKN